MSDETPIEFVMREDNGIVVHIKGKSVPPGSKGSPSVEISVTVKRSGNKPLDIGEMRREIGEQLDAGIDEGLPKIVKAVNDTNRQLIQE